MLQNYCKMCNLKELYECVSCSVSHYEAFFHTMTKHSLWNSFSLMTTNSWESNVPIFDYALIS